MDHAELLQGLATSLTALCDVVNGFDATRCVCDSNMVRSAGGQQRLAVDSVNVCKRKTVFEVCDSK